MPTLYCDDCQSSERICQLCGNCYCDGYKCVHQERKIMPTQSQIELENALTRINQASNETRIKLEALRGAYINLARYVHETQRIYQRELHPSSSWRECNHAACKSNKNVLEKLGLL